MRFTDGGETRFTFGEEFLVRCPACERCAKVRRRSLEPRVSAACQHCGWSKFRNDSMLTIHDDGKDWFFDLPLWLQVTCCGEILWANNEAHLGHMKRFVEAHLRERSSTSLAKNSTLASRYPDWMKAATNRADVLAGIAKLERMLRDADKKK